MFLNGLYNDHWNYGAVDGSEEGGENGGNGN